MGLFPELKKKVLVVDDEFTIQDLVAFTLEPEFFVIKAANGKEALDAVTAEKPDIIILDIMMPGLDGYHVCQRLKSGHDTKHIPIIMLTAKHQVPDMRKAIEVQVDEYITKPFEPDFLRKRIHACLDGEKEQGNKLFQAGKSLHYVRGQK